MQKVQIYIKNNRKLKFFKKSEGPRGGGGNLIMIKAGSHFFWGIYFPSLSIPLNSLIMYFCRFIFIPVIYLYFLSDCLSDINYLFVIHVGLL